MFKKKKLAEQICLSLLASFTALGAMSAVAEEANTQGATQAEEPEVITVTGIRSSLKESLSAKKDAQQIMDAISSEDIGKLPDTNVAEALSRITGVQINRNDAGDGSGFQVRGLSQNRVEVNGRSMVSNSDGSRSNSFSATSSALFKGIEVIKTPTADTVEGALGATIRLKTFKPLDFKKSFTYTGNFQYVGQDNANKDKGLIASSLLATRWDVGEGEMGALINVSHEDRDITTTRWTSKWEVPLARPNTQCNGGLGDTATGVFDPNLDDVTSDVGCERLAMGTIYGTDGTVANGADYPVLDKDYGRDSGGVVEQHEPLLAYTVIHPGQFVWERKPFHNQKTGVDVNFQWAPSASFDMYVQGTYSKFDQIRPQSKIIFPGLAGGANSRLQDGFIIQEFDRPATGDEYVITDQETDMPVFGEEGQYLTPETGNVKRGVLLAGTLTKDGARFANNNQNKEEEQLVLATGFTYQTDDWTIEGELSRSSSETFEDALNLNVGFANSQTTTWDFTDGRFDLPVVGILGPNTTYDKESDTCYTNQQSEDSTDNNPIYTGSINDPNCGGDLVDWQNFTFGSFNGKYTWFDNAETSAKLDFDYYIDKSIFTTLEFGVRLTDSKMTREQVQLNDIENPSNSPFINNNTDGVFGDLNTDGVTGDGDKKFIVFEDLEPGFVRKGLGVTPDFIENYSASTLFPRQWLTPIQNEQYDIWFDRLNGRGFWQENTAYEYELNEKSQAAYIKANFESELFGMPYMGNLGVRFIKYDFEIDSHQLHTDDEGNIVKATERVETLNGVPVDVSLDQVEGVHQERSISDVLPSGNITFVLQDDMYLRFAAAKALSMPNPTDMVTTAPLIRTGDTGIVNHWTGNINLDPYEANQYDISYEWYMSDTSAITAAYFRKDLKTFIVKATEIEVISDQLLLNKVVPVNTDGGTINGVELSYRSTFDGLPGLWSGFGVETNYTFTDSSQNSGVNELTGEEVPIKDLSENSYNFILFYDKYGFQFRAAYNYRDTNFKGIESGKSDRSGYISPMAITGDDGNTYYNAHEPFSVALGRYEKGRGTLDLSLSYKVNKHLTFSLQGSNVTNEPLEQYQGVAGMTSSFIDPGAAYRAGVRISFR